MKRCVSIGLVIIMFFYLIQSTFVTAVAHAEDGRMDGSGSPANPYIITTAAQLDSVRNNLTASYKLGNDIDLSGYDNWQPIGTDYSHGFSGTFDGAGHSIRNLKINRPNSDYVGLFGCAENASLINIVLENVDVSGSMLVAGLVGEIDSGEISNSGVSGTVSGNFNAVGGLAGFSGSTISESYSTANISGAVLVGGLVGHAAGNINNSYALGNVTGTNDVGGLVGAYFYPGSVTNSYAAGHLSVAPNVQGIVGYKIGSVSITNSFYNQETSGINGNGDVAAKSTAEMQTKSTYTNAGWDFNTIWKMNPGEYPTFLYQEKAYQVTYDSNGATGSVPSDPTNYKNGDQATTKENTGNLVKVGYTFRGWNTKADGTGTAYQPGASLTVTGNVTLYAQWVSVYRVSYDSNGGAGTVPSDLSNYQNGDHATVKENSGNLAKAGYTFNGWNTKADGSGTSYQSGDTLSVTGNLTLYAQWKVIPTYHVSYNLNLANSGAVPNDLTDYLEGETATVQGNSGNLIRTGYVFNGWNTEADGSGTSYQPGAVFTVNDHSVTLYAQWRPLVTFNYNNGDLPSSVAVNDQGKVNKPTDPSKTGFDFTGWLLDNGPIPFNFDTKISDPTQLYASWALHFYSIDYVTNGGSPVVSDSVPFGLIVPPFHIPTKAGYTFAGWYRDAGLTQPYNFSAPVTSDMTLYAKWSINHYAIAFDSNGGSTVANQMIDYNDQVSKPNNPTRTGYSFAGWYSDSGLTQSYDFITPVTANATVYAKWSINHYAIAFDSNGGNTVADQTIDYNDQVSKPDDPTRTGYSFAGWYSDSGLTQPYDFSTPVTSDMTLYAKWSINHYAIAYDSNGGSTLADQIVDYNDQASKPDDPTRTGYSFAGWYSDSSLTEPYDFDTAVTGSTTLYARWVPLYTVAYNGNGNTSGTAPVDSQSYSLGAIVNILNPFNLTKTGYHFLNWNDSSDGSGNQYLPGTTFTIGSSDLSLFAKWDKNRYTVTYDSNNGSAIPAQTVAFEDKASKPDDPTRTGYGFGGWYKDSGLTEPYDFDTAVTGNTTLYAKWGKNSYTVTYDSNGGSAVADQTIAFENKVNEPADPTRSGYTFVGWFKNSDLTKLYDFDTLISQNTTLYAKWLSASNTLSALKLSDQVALSPVFDEKTTNYTAKADYDDSQLTLTFSANDSGKTIRVNGKTVDGDHTTIPLSVGANMIKIEVTAADGVTKKTYTIQVVRSDEPKAATKTIYANVVSDSNADVLTKTPIKQTTNNDGTVSDAVSLSEDDVQETVSKLKNATNKIASIIIPDETDQVSEFNVSVPNQAMNTLAHSNSALQIMTDGAHILVPHQSIANFNDNLYFRVVPVKSETDQHQIKEQAAQVQIVQEAVKGDPSSIKVLGRPMQIETNMQNHLVTLTLPLPDDHQLTDEMLNNLVIFIQHSDGTQEVVRGHIVTFASGVRGIQFDVTKFSTFTVLYMKGADQYFASASEQNNSIPTKPTEISTNEPVSKTAKVSEQPEPSKENSGVLPITGDTNDIFALSTGAILLLSGGIIAIFMRRRRTN